MATTCLNCGTAVPDKFCPHCGQEISVKRLTWNHVAMETIHFFTHIEHGFIKTTKDLLFTPATVQKDYIEGKRKAYHKPLSFLLIWVAIFLVVTTLTKRFGHFEEDPPATFLSINPEIDAMILKYRALIELLILPFTALNAWLLLAWPRLTYLEMLITGFYRFAVFYIFLTLLSIIGWIAGFNPESPVSIYSFALFNLGWTFYVFYSFFKLYQVEFLVLRILGTIAIGLSIYATLRILIARIFISWGL
jgi:hypothetical protein